MKAEVQAYGNYPPAQPGVSRARALRGVSDTRETPGETVTTGKLAARSLSVLSAAHPVRRLQRWELKRVKPWGEQRTGRPAPRVAAVRSPQHRPGSAWGLGRVVMVCGRRDFSQSGLPVFKP